MVIVFIEGGSHFMFFCVYLLFLVGLQTFVGQFFHLVPIRCRHIGFDGRSVRNDVWGCRLGHLQSRKGLVGLVGIANPSPSFRDAFVIVVLSSSRSSSSGSRSCSIPLLEFHQTIQKVKGEPRIFPVFFFFCCFFRVSRLVFVVPILATVVHFLLFS
jgi:hypothetical protein